jgi:Histidine kinase-like ATPase domain
VCHLAKRTLPPDPTAVPLGRHFVAEQLRSWGLVGLVSDAAVIASELVSNAVLHGAGPLRIVVSLDEDGVELAVADRSGIPPQVPPVREDLLADLDALNRQAPGHQDARDPSQGIGPAGVVGGGRGMHVIAALSHAWGYRAEGDGKTVWARLTLPAAEATTGRAAGHSMSQ